MNTPEWIEYDGSEEQIAEMNGASNGILIKGSKILQECKIYKWHQIEYLLDCVPYYLICQPHPYADLIKIWADTGCPVWVRPTKPYEFKISDYLNHPTTKLMVDHRGVYLITTAPDWNIQGEYSLTPF